MSASDDNVVSITTATPVGTGNQEPPRQDSPARKPLTINLTTVFAAASVVVAIVALIVGIIFGTTNTLSSQIRDVNTNINAGIGRLQEEVRSDIGNAENAVQGVADKVDALSLEVSYIKGRLDKQRDDKTTSTANENP